MGAYLVTITGLITVIISTPITTIHSVVITLFTIQHLAILQNYLLFICNTQHSNKRLLIINKSYYTIYNNTVWSIASCMNISYLLFICNNPTKLNTLNISNNLTETTESLLSQPNNTSTLPYLTKYSQLTKTNSIKQIIQ